MSYKIDIQDASLLKVTKVRKWVVCFSYAAKGYMLHLYGDDSSNNIALYERSVDRTGRWELKYINSERFYNSTIDGLVGWQPGKTIVYKLIDKKYFALKLTELGFATGVMEQEVAFNSIMKRFTEIDEQLKHIRFHSAILVSQIKEFGEKFIKEEKTEVNRS